MFDRYSSRTAHRDVTVVKTEYERTGIEQIYEWETTNEKK